MVKPRQKRETSHHGIEKLQKKNCMSILYSNFKINKKKKIKICEMFNN